MLGDPIAKREERAVRALLEKGRATVSLVGGAHRAGERGPRVVVARIVEVKGVAHKVKPTELIERRCVAAADRLAPLVRPARDVGVHRTCRWRHVVRGGIAVQVRGNHRVPAEHSAYDGLHFLLGHRHQVAVHIEPVVIEPPADAPRLIALLLERLALGASNSNRIAPDRKALVAVRVGARVDYHDGVLEPLEGGRVVACRKVVEQLHRGLKPRHLVAVHGAGEPDDRRGAGNHFINLCLRRPPRVGDAVQVCANGVEPRNIFRCAHQEDAHCAPLVADTNLLDPHAVRRRLGDCQQHPLLQVVLRVRLADVEAEDRLRPRNARAVRSLGVEREVAVVAERFGRSALGAKGRSDEQEQRKEQTH